MPYLIQHISGIVNAKSHLVDPSLIIDQLLIDSRRLVFPATTLFFALQSPRRSGESFVADLYEAGVRSFVVTKTFDGAEYKEANFLKVDEPLIALQHLVSYHRQQYNFPIIGITGSNGKTMVKEWLYHLLQPDYNIVRSPKSYNSQIGVPLSVWQINETHDLGIFEAGISEEGEMDALQNIIRPTIGILTNIRAAHAAGFKTQADKLREKWKLFKSSLTIVCTDDSEVVSALAASEPRERLFTWGNESADLHIVRVEKENNQATITASHLGSPCSITIPFSDNASIENAITCWCLLLFLKVEQTVIAARMKTLQGVEMRLQLKKAINNCSLINDSYSNDISSLRIALDFLEQQAGSQLRTVILSDLGENQSTEGQYQKVLQSLVDHKVNNFIGIGPRLTALQHLFKASITNSLFYPTVESFMLHWPAIRFRDEVILLKGARQFQFEQINALFEQKVHQTVMEVNLTAMAHNLKEYQNYLQPSTKVMAMVKAFSYGAGSAEVASVLQFHKVDYLAVAYADEGVDLRKAGIQLPIIVMNPETVTFQSLVEYNLEPEIFSFGILTAFNDYLVNEGLQQVPVHIKIDTGMHRLGFELSQVDDLIMQLKQSKVFVVKSVFSHFVGSENADHDDFSHRQAQLFTTACERIQGAIGYKFMRHISNSAAIFRHPQYQFDLVRLGIGLYGVDSIAESELALQTVATLRTTIAQVRKVAAGESIGYSRKGILNRDSLIATIRIGYADGFNRILGNGIGKVFLKGKLANVVGNVCMDMTMIDVTEIENVQEGDVVEIFGPNLSVTELAAACDTISYEIMTGISQRVKREYYQE